MKNVFFLLSVLALLTACQPDRKNARQALQTDLATLEQRLLAAKDASKDRAAALELVEKTMEYAKDFPQDTLTPTLLFKAGDVANGAREYGKAVELWGLVWQQYEQHPKAPMALFLQGFTFDSALRDTAMAVKHYNQFLLKYPENELAPQVKQLMNVVAVKPEDLIKRYEVAE